MTKNVNMIINFHGGLFINKTLTFHNNVGNSFPFTFKVKSFAEQNNSMLSARVFLSRVIHLYILAV